MRVLSRAASLTQVKRYPGLRELVLVIDLKLHPFLVFLPAPHSQCTGMASQKALNTDPSGLVRFVTRDQKADLENNKRPLSPASKEFSKKS